MNRSRTILLGGSGSPGGSSGDIQTNNGSGGFGSVTAANIPAGTPTDDNVWVGDGSAWAKKALGAGMVSYNTTGNVFAGRTITGTGSEITVTNGDGLSGNPTLSLVSGTQKVNRPGGVTSTVTSYPTASYFKLEDWVLAGAVCTAASRTCGEFHWWMTGTDSAMVGGAADVNHPGVRILRAGSTTPVAGEACVIDSTAATGTLIWPNNFDTIWVVQSGTSDANTKTRFGLSPDFGTDPPTTGAYFEKEHAGDVGGSDTNWFFVCGDGTRTRVDTNVAHSTAWTTGRITRVNATTIGWAICAGDGCTLPALTNATTNCPSASTEARPGARVETNTTAARDLSLDYIDLLVTGITR